MVKIGGASWKAIRWNSSYPTIERPSAGIRNSVRLRPPKEWENIISPDQRSYYLIPPDISSAEQVICSTRLQERENEREKLCLPVSAFVTK